MCCDIWRDQWRIFEESTGLRITTYLVGNKNDLEKVIQVIREIGMKFTEDNNALFFETSVKSLQNNKETINKIIETIVDKQLSKKSNEQER